MVAIFIEQLAAPDERELLFRRLTPVDHESLGVAEPGATGVEQREVHRLRFIVAERHLQTATESRQTGESDPGTEFENFGIAWPVGSQNGRHHFDRGGPEVRPVRHVLIAIEGGMNFGVFQKRIG